MRTKSTFSFNAKTFSPNWIWNFSIPPQFILKAKGDREELARACGKYLLTCRMANVSEIKRDVLTKRGRYTTFKDNLQAKEVIVGDGERRRRYILCYNPKEAKRQQKHRAQLVESLEQELARHSDRSAKAQWAIELLA